MPTRPTPPGQGAPARAPGTRRRSPAGQRAAIVPPPVRPERDPAGLSQKTRASRWPTVPGVGARPHPATSTLPTRRAGRAAVPGPKVIQTCPPRRGKAVGIRARAAIRTSDRHPAPVGSMITTGTSRPVPPSVSAGTSPTTPPTRHRGVAAPAADRTAPIRRITRSRACATAGKLRSISPETSREPSPAQNDGVGHGRTAGLRVGPRPTPGNTTSSDPTGSRGAGRTPRSPGRSSPAAPRRSHSRRAVPARLAPEPRGLTRLR